MARDGGKVDGRTDGAHGPRECMPCRGTGQVISNLGGSPRRVTCPWCRGDGVRLAGIDTQAAEKNKDSVGASAPHAPADAAT